MSNSLVLKLTYAHGLLCKRWKSFFVCGFVGLPWDLFFLGWNYEVAHPDANRKMHYVIEKSNKILGEEKEKTEGVHSTAYTHPELSK